ncbi:Alanine racemase [Microbulbifer aggregans]|uniref:Alanine racemase n=1 Tax=Microbulbifer aggregans TaxID=1769779 RepID=A0A1C9W6R9_9GAMM|nr:alanine racemase [Microbulbifer aggregans]AOS96808.1 Alanine racemase [Microbulbifer aggregans]
MNQPQDQWHGLCDEGLLQIDLEGIGRNYDLLQRKVGSVERCGAVVKADAYGLGVRRVAPVLWARGCRHFFVATLEEGAVLRQQLGDEAEIVVLTGIRPGTEWDCLQAGLVPTIFTTSQLRAWADTQEKSGRAARCALKVDTGMTRLGMGADEYDLLLRDPGLLAAAQVDLLMSHLACADEPGHPQNRLQLDAFRRAGDRLKRVLPSVRQSLANSSGVFLDKAYHFDLARPGCALYGVNPTPGTPNPMSAVVTLELPVIQIREVTRDCQVGYGATQTAVAGSWLAVARGGYADGVLRAQGGRGCGWAHGQRLPMVGRVSMDSATYDITGLSSGQRASLDHIQLLNRYLTVDEVAEYAGTIGYEILTSLGRRYRRQYLESTAEPTDHE